MQSALKEGEGNEGSSSLGDGLPAQAFIEHQIFCQIKIYIKNCSKLLVHLKLNGMNLFPNMIKINVTK
jgi:hypothetical protein